MTIELDPSNKSTNINGEETTFVKQVLDAGEALRTLNRDNYYYQLGFLSATGILDKISQWQNFQEDGRILASNEADGRFVLNLRWNFRELNGKQVCDEVGMAYVGEAATPLAEYEASSIVGSGRNSDIFEYNTPHYEKAEFLLVWGNTPKLVRYFSHGEVKRVLQDLNERTDSLEDKDTINFTASQRAFEDSVRFIDQEGLMIEAVYMSDEEIQEILQKFEIKRVESGTNLNKSLISAITDPRIRVNPKDKVVSPFPNDNGSNSIQLLGKLERRVEKTEWSSRKKLLDRESRLLRAAGRAIDQKEKTRLAALHRPTVSYYDGIIEEEMAGYLDIMDEDDYYVVDDQHPADDCYEYEDGTWSHDDHCEDAPSY